MNSTLVFCIVATAFVLVQCEDAPHLEDDKPHHFKLRNCKNKKLSGKFDSLLLTLGDGTGHFPAPQPLEKFVKLAGNYKYNPSMVIVKRCDGQCDEELTLQAVKSRNRTFPALQYADGMPANCVVVKVEEHRECACMCLKKETACKNPQRLDTKTCTCECPDQYDDAKYFCEEYYSGTKYWNSTTCSCECNETPIKAKCRTDTPEMWNVEACSCDSRWN